MDTLFEKWQKALPAFLLGTGVFMGAIGAHGLSKTTPNIDLWQTAVFYHLIHALGLAWLQSQKEIPVWVSQLMLTGLTLFCGSIYALVLSEVSQLKAITPLGGILFLFAWVSATYFLLKSSD